MLKTLTDPITACVSALLATRRFARYPHVHLATVDFTPVESTDAPKRGAFVAIAFGKGKRERSPNSPWPSPESMTRLERLFNGQPEWQRDFFPQGEPTLYGFTA